ncbi:hypothetical protein BDW42DRAFT_13144 [Aspergillus taichungensis]|uniref:Uncharacterized protein n=1 Tax=Aspergillus taichungensis TaxID=482145 RepID=A0A2J5HJ09_9EURO|nr:hypothetical protein BDW42DRAFT_13144 [Aspergillus taichungensis]
MTHTKSTRMMTMMAATGTASLQYVMIMLHAVISKGTMAASKMKKLYPAATPNASSTYRPAKRMKGDEIGRYVTISARPKEPVVSTCYTRPDRRIWLQWGTMIRGTWKPMALWISAAVVDETRNCFGKNCCGVHGDGGMGGLQGLGVRVSYKQL